MTLEKDDYSRLYDEDGNKSLAGSIPNTKEYYERAKIFYNVVDEITIAAQIPCPDIYILPKENSINSMATGPFNDDGAILVTLGALRRLTRDELQGLVAHEISHLVNGDGVFYSVLAGWMTGLLTIKVFGDSLADHEEPIVVFLGFCLTVIGFLSTLIAKIIQAAYSRQREYLADARAVEFSRSKENLASVLKKVGGYSEGSRIRNPLRSAYSHFFLGSTQKRNFLFSTHPPLEKRILILDPSWDGKYFDFIKYPVNYLEGSKPFPFNSQSVLPIEPLFLPQNPMSNPESLVSLSPSPPLELLPHSLPLLIMAYSMEEAKDIPSKVPNTLGSKENLSPKAFKYQKARGNAVKPE
jgi:Zn-dependent protease with chaperone function